MSLLRRDLLDGARIAVADGMPGEVEQALAGLGGQLERLDVSQLPADEERVGEWARARAPLHGLVVFAAPSFGQGGPEALTGTLDRIWATVREVAVGALIEAEHPGKLVLVAPPSDAGPLAGAARAGLENLTRTLSVEWARYGLTAAMVAPGPGTTDKQLATLIAFLLSKAGGYLSGCLLELGGATMDA